MAQYGVLGEVVATAGSLAAAASAISLAWMRRAKWLPPQETLPDATRRVSALLCAVVIAFLYLRRDELGVDTLGLLALILLPLVLVSLGASIYVNTAYSYDQRIPGKAARRILGGFRLTAEADDILTARKRSSVQQLLDDAKGKPDLVWTPGSLAAAQVASTMGFIALQATGSIALAAVSLAISMKL